jgi:WD40 repeat protein
MPVRDLRALFESLAAQYEYLSDNRTKLEADCTKLREYIDSQVQQIQSLNADFEKLRQDYVQRRSQMDRLAIEAENRRQSVPPPPPAMSPSTTAPEEPEQEWEVEALLPADKIEHPLLITLLAEIVDVSVICSTSFSPDGSCLAIGSDKTLRVYKIDKDDFVFQHNLEEDDEQGTNHIRSITWTNDNQTVLCGGEDGKVRIFSLTENGLLHTIEVGLGEVFQVAISNSNEYFAAAAGDGVLSLFQFADLEPLGRLQRDTESPIVATSASISPDDRYIAVGYSDWHIGVWEFATKQLVLTHSAHTLGVYAVKFVPNRPLLLTASLDQTVKIWRWNAGVEGKEPNVELQTCLEGHSSYVLSLAIDPTGDLILSGSKDLTARISSISAGAMLYKVKGHTNSIISVAYNSKGNMFCTGSGDRSVKIWSITAEEMDDAA